MEVWRCVQEATPALDFCLTFNTVFPKCFPLYVIANLYVPALTHQHTCCAKLHQCTRTVCESPIVIFIFLLVIILFSFFLGVSIFHCSLLLLYKDCVLYSLWKKFQLTHVDDFVIVSKFPSTKARLFTLLSRFSKVCININKILLNVILITMVCGIFLNYMCFCMKSILFSQNLSYGNAYLFILND